MQVNYALNLVIKIIIMLNLWDLILTYFGLKLEFIHEVNPIMNILYNCNPVIFITIKAIIPTILLIFISGHVHKIKYCEYPLMFLFLLYSGLMILHLRWIYIFVS
ncbi:MAG: hypothetical protein PWQ96_471 [Clostridia bacterium]|nr:hypothetical protein [Clostridiales bacterium]MDK2984829.1 hypothetical protein [Clostridia bacterium]